MNCPKGFEKTLDNNCRVQCPLDFKYVQDPPLEKCVHVQNNGIAIPLTVLPLDVSPSTYANELGRFEKELVQKLQDLQMIQRDRDEITGYQTENTVRGAQFSSVQREYTGYKTLETIQKQLQDTSKAIRPVRSAESDIERERKAILSLTEPKLLLVQVVLALVVASLISYLLLPINVAHGLTFLLLCVGIAVGIFLKE
jgi:hypothetical protein